MSEGPRQHDADLHPLPGAETGRWNARVWAIAGPIILSNLSTPLLGAVDTAVMGALPSPDFIGGVAVGAIIFDFLFWGFGFLRMGTTGFTAQAHGAGEHDELRAVLLRPLLLALAIGALLILLQEPIGRAALHFIPASDAVTANAALYFQIRIWSAPATLANYALIGWLLGTQRPRAVLALQILLNSVNIVLDLVFVLWLGWGIEGVAAASLIAEVAAAGIGLAIVLRVLPRLDRTWDWPRIFERRRLVALFRVNFDIMLRTLCLTAAFYYLTVRGAAMGDVVLAANNVLLRFVAFMAFGLDGFAHAVEVLAGSAYGARHRRAFREAVTTATLWSVGLAVLICLVYFVVGRELLWLFTTEVPEVRAAAALYLPWIVVAPLVSVWGYMLDGIFIGATRTAEMRNAMILSLLCFLLACWWLIPAFGNHGLWAAFSLFMLARAVTLGLFYPAILRRLENPAEGAGKRTPAGSGGDPAG